MRGKPLGIIVFVLLLLAAVPLMRVLLSRSAPEAQPVTDLHVPGRGVVRITAYWIFGQNLGLYYQVLPEDVLTAEPAAAGEADEPDEPAEVGQAFGTLSPPIPYPKFVVHQA